MATLAEIRQAIADTLTNAGIRCEPIVPDNPNPPLVVVRPTGWTIETMGHGVARYAFQIQVLAGSVSDRAGQKTLDELCSATGAGSVSHALFSTPALGAVATNAWMGAMTDYGTTVLADGGPRYYSALLDLFVLTTIGG